MLLSLLVPLLALAAAVGVALAAAPGKLTSHTNKVITVLPTAVLHLAGSTIYCTVNKGSTVTVTCFHLKSQGRDGYAIAASDKLVAVEPTGSTKPVFLRSLKSLKGVPVFSGGHPGRTVPIDMHKGDVAAVGTTHMAVLVSTAKVRGPALSVVYLAGLNSPIIGTYAASVGDHFVTVARVVSPQKTQVVYHHAVR